MTILTIVGARPQFIKAAVVSRAIRSSKCSARRGPRVKEILVHTGQHYDDNMSGIFFRELDMPPPSRNLGVGSGPHGQQTGRMLEGLERVMEQERPNLVLVYGDTNSTLAGGLAASKLGFPVAHVEAGLRSYNRTMPEEINRVVVDHLSALLFCPTLRAEKNLMTEGVTKGVHVVGDVMYDSLLYSLGHLGTGEELLARFRVEAGSYGLVTLHRAENTDDPKKLRATLYALEQLDLDVLFPVHPRTQAAFIRSGITRLPSRVRSTPPLSYREVLSLIQHARLVLTDSGGIQKEAFLLKVPCLTLRNETEWVETVDAGWNSLVGTDPDKIVATSRDFLERRLPEPGYPYGDGTAGEKIIRTIQGYLLGHES